MNKSAIQRWVFVMPSYSHYMNNYYAGILDFLKDHPNIFLESQLFTQHPPTGRIAGYIAYSVPPSRYLDALRKHGNRPTPFIAITTREKLPPLVIRAHIDSYKVAQKVVAKFIQRHCQSFAFCSTITPNLTNESAQLLLAYHREVRLQTGKIPHLYRPFVTLNPNLLPAEVKRFVTWFKTMPKPCAMFAHGDDVAKKMLDTCRLHNIDVPRELCVISIGNSELYCERTFPTLSSFSVNQEYVGYTAAQTLYNLIERKLTPSAASFEIPIPEIIERASSIDQFGTGRLADEARQFIHESINHGHAPSILDVAHHFNVSRTKIQKDFLLMTGHTLHAELANYRLERLAKILRASSEPINYLARKVGFATISQANRAFKAHFGVTMNTFRRSPLR